MIYLDPWRGLKKQSFRHKSLISCLVLLFSSLQGWAYDNPFLSEGSQFPDGKVGAFRQNNTGDCFFLASLIALAQDPEGKLLIESALKQSDNNNVWQISFHNLADQAITVTQQELAKYQLKNSAGNATSRPAIGDPDVKLLEIAADKIWKTTIKAEGLWDDVSMNAVFMFTSAQQFLLWNRNKAQKTSIEDIDKYQRIAGNTIIESQLSSVAEVEKTLREITASDHDGISMILIDYLNYHAVAIIEIDFIHRIYSYLGTYSHTRYVGDLDELLLRVAKGDYALNYLEIGL